MVNFSGIKWRFKSDRENLIPLLIVAVLIGMLTGALAVGFRYLLLVATRICWQNPFDIIGAASNLSWYIVVLIPVLGGLLVGPIVAILAPETRGAGVPEVINAVASRQGIIRHRTTFYKIISTVISIGSGASVGREGPIVHIGSSVGSSMAQLIRLPPESRSVFLACGAAAGIAATFNAPMAGMLFAVVLIFKLAATSFSVGAGFSGGIFAPSLVLGALLGGVFGVAVNNLFPEWVAAYPAYGLVGMGAIVSGATMAPITAIFTIFELTYNFEIILPLMTSCIASLIIVKKFYGNSIYETKLLKKGIKIVRGHDVNLLRSIPVTEYMEKEYESIGDNTGLEELIIKAQESTYPHFIVLNSKDELVGILSMRDLKNCLSDMDYLCELIVAADIMSKNVYCLVPDDTLETAFEVFEGKHISTLPVVDSRNRKKVFGILKKSNLILAYNEKILKTHILQHRIK